jgi:hypothetical protein
MNNSNRRAVNLFYIRKQSYVFPSTRVIVITSSRGRVDGIERQWFVVIIICERVNWLMAMEMWGGDELCFTDCAPFAA